MTPLSGTSTSSPARGQLRALVSLRWRMIREPNVRWGLVSLAFVPVAVTALGALVLQMLPDDESFNIAVATPTLYLGFALLAIIAPLAAGGGYELYPSERAGFLSAQTSHRLSSHAAPSARQPCLDI